MLGELSANDVRVELLFNPPDSDCRVLPMATTNSTTDSKSAAPSTFSTKVGCRVSGKRQLAVRVVPAVANLSTPFEPGLIRWA